MKYISNRKVCNLTLQVPSHNEILCKAHILDYKTRQYSRNSRAVLGQLRPLCVLCVCCRNCPCRSSFRVVFKGIENACSQVDSSAVLGGLDTE